MTAELTIDRPSKIELVALYMLNAKRTYRLTLEEARKLGGWTDMQQDASIAIRACQDCASEYPAESEK